MRAILRVVAGGGWSCEDTPQRAYHRRRITRPSHFHAQNAELEWTRRLWLDLYACSVHRPGMNLLVNQVKNAMADLAKAKGLTTARVDQKTNAKGELVIALIIPPSRPGEWTEK